jgi:ABC-type enterochelin transport system substrate-binding protein
VRIKPDGEKLMRGNRLLYNNDYIEKSHLLNIIDKESWEYDVPGYITMDDFKQIISNKLVLPQKALLNGKIPMDATNYYIQSGDMRDLEALIPNL